MCPEGGRGKHTNNPEVPQEHIDTIKEHIRMFPSYESHYSRSNSDTKYLSPDLSRLYQLCYKLYEKFSQLKGLEPRGEACNRRVFVNIST